MSMLDTFGNKAAKELSDKTEQFLRRQVAILGITVDEFVRDYVFEQWPIEYSLSDGLSDDLTIKFRTQFHVRRKTDEELSALPVPTEDESA